MNKIFLNENKVQSLEFLIIRLTQTNIAICINILAGIYKTISK